MTPADYDTARAEYDAALTAAPLRGSSSTPRGPSTRR